MQKKHRFCLFLTKQQMDVLRDASEQAQLSTGEIVRRVFDQTLIPAFLNEIIPTASGQLSPVIHRVRSSPTVSTP